MGTGIVALDLGEKPRGAQPPAAGQPDCAPLHETLDEALATIATVLTAACDGVPIADAISTVSQCRAQLMAGAPPDVLDPLARACFESTRNTAAHARIRRGDARCGENAAFVR